MQQTCRQCQKVFDIMDDDLKFLDKLSPVIGGKKEALPPPALCFNCRLQRRLAFYNARSLYKRTCSFSNKPIVSIFSPDKPYKVYEKSIWFGDQWDPLEYGHEFDFNRPFFPQFKEFAATVPLQSIAHIGPDNINSDFTNDNYKLKNCYLVFDGEQAEDCYYGQTFVKTKNSMDFLFLTYSELCYDCVHCDTCYALHYSRYCQNCSSSRFLRDCIGCKDCFGCANLRQKQYCIFNEQKTKAEYEAFIATFQSDSWIQVQAMRLQAEQFLITQPVKACRGEQNVGCTGDNINQCKNSHWCFDCRLQEECRYSTDCLMSAKDCMDVHIWGDGMELTYNCCVVGANSRNLVCDYYVTQGCNDVLYSLYCLNACKHLFGCIGLKRKDHCILNKQYTPEQYDALAARIIQHMRSTGEWGEYFPPEQSLFGYNETMANTFFPLTKEAVLAKGWQWSDYQPDLQVERVIPAAQLPDRTPDIPDDLVNWAITCEATGKPFRVIQQELDFYRAQRLPVPRRHPDQRHMDRFAHKNPCVMFDRTCSKCGKPIQTSEPPDRQEIVYCEKCYLETVY